MPWYAPEDPTPREQCPCCGYVTLPERGKSLICPVCFWEDDPVQAEDLSFAGGANAVSLAEARENYLQSGACELRLSDQVRHARIGELPIPSVPISMRHSLRP